MLLAPVDPEELRSYVLLGQCHVVMEVDGHIDHLQKFLFCRIVHLSAAATPSDGLQCAFFIRGRVAVLEDGQSGLLQIG